MECFAMIEVNNSVENVQNGDPVKIWVPCGKCIACQSNRREHWSVRLEEELRVSSSAYFVTLTFSEEPVNGVGTEIFQKYMKRLRKAVSLKCPDARLRYYCTAEYGANTFRPHYHLLLFNLPPNCYDDITSCWTDFSEDSESLRYKCGFTHVGKVTPATINYTTKYMIKDAGFSQVLEDNLLSKPRSYMSKGLGKAYCVRMKEWHAAVPEKRVYVPTKDGRKRSMPRYYKTALGLKAKPLPYQDAFDKYPDAPLPYYYDMAVKQSIERRALRNKRNNNLL